MPAPLSPTRHTTSPPSAAGNEVVLETPARRSSITAVRTTSISVLTACLGLAGTHAAPAPPLTVEEVFAAAEVSSGTQVGIGQ